MDASGCENFFQNDLGMPALFDLVGRLERLLWMLARGSL